MLVQLLVQQPELSQVLYLEPLGPLQLWEPQGLDLQDGGITNAGAIAGANRNIFKLISGAAGTFTTITGTSLNLQNGGIVNAGIINGSTKAF